MVLVVSEAKVTEVVAVLSEGTVVTAVTSVEEISVTGMTTVDFVVGGSEVEVV